MQIWAAKIGNFFINSTAQAKQLDKNLKQLHFLTQDFIKNLNFWLFQNSSALL